jgi:hypothetical protein
MGASFTAARTALTISAHSSVGSDGPDWPAHAQSNPNHHAAPSCCTALPSVDNSQQRSSAVRAATQRSARHGAALPDASDLSAVSTASWSLASSAGSGPSWSRDVPDW